MCLQESSWSPSSSPCAREFSDEGAVKDSWTGSHSNMDNIHNLMFKAQTDNSSTEFCHRQSDGSVEKMRLNQIHFHSKAERKTMKKLSRLSLGGGRRGDSEMRAHKSKTGLKKMKRSVKAQRHFPYTSPLSEGLRMEDGLPEQAFQVEGADLKQESNQETDLSSCDTDTLVTDEDIMVESGMCLFRILCEPCLYDAAINLQFISDFFLPL